MGQTCIQMFEQQIYPELFAKAAEHTINCFEQQQEKRTEEWKRLLQQYVGQLIALQEECAAPPVEEIDISFLYTSLEETSKEDFPKFQIDSYGKGGRVANSSILTGYVPADWIAEGAEELSHQLTERVKEEGLRCYIRAAEIDTLKLRAVRSFLYYFALRFKYDIQEMLDFKSIAKIKKEPHFFIQIGEYMDWQKTIYAVRPAVDIFNCEKNTELRFRNFSAISYKDKQFKDLNLSQSSFKDCTFEDSSIKGCTMSDCMFDGCVFERVTVNATKLTGSIFVNCTFREVVFEETVFFENFEKKADNSVLEYFEPAEFHDCGFISLKFKSCSLVACPVRNCDTYTVEIEDSDIDGSGFEGITQNMEG